MDARWGWFLALAALAVGWWSYGWQGLVLAVTLIVFWLLLQFSRTMRVLRDAAGAPLGRVPSAVMFQARLRRGLPLGHVIRLAGSLGRKAGGSAQETYIWADDSGASVRVSFDGGRCQAWQLVREAQNEEGSAEAGP